MSLPRWLLPLALAPLMPLPSSLAQTAAVETAAASEKLSPTELAYWQQLQSELIALRSANLAAGIRSFPMELRTAEQLSAIASRTEEFLDRRDGDPVDQLGAELKEYRERLINLLDTALIPVTAAVKFHTTLVTNGEERMQTVITNHKQVEAIDSHKPRLALLHEKLNARIVAAGGESRLFFQTLGLGDKPREPGSFGTPEERDARFLEEAAAIGEPFAALAKGIFVDNRIATGLTDSLMEPLMSNIEQFRTQFADVPSDQLEEALTSSPGLQEESGTFNSKRHVLRLDLMRRADIVAYSIAMQEFQGAFQRWVGKADDVLPAGLCRDVAVSSDGSWFAYTPSFNEIVVRSTADGSVRKTIRSEHAVRALTGTSTAQLLVFSAAGLFQTNPADDEPTLELRADRKSAFLQPRIARARDAEAYIYALGVMPAIANKDAESTMAMDKATSRITAVAMNADGSAFAIGYAGDHLTGSGDPNFGFTLMTGDSKTAGGLAGTEIKGRSQHPPVTSATLGLSLSADGQRVAAAYYGKYAGVVTLDIFSEGEQHTRHIYAIDGEPYTWVHYLETEKPRVIAGSRNGVVRIWDADTRDLLSRFQVPAGPSGAAYALLGEELISVALGQPGVHRWKIADGSLVASYDGAASPADAATIAATIAAERALQPTRDLIAAMLDIDAENTEAKLKTIEPLRGAEAPKVAALSQTQTINQIVAILRSQQILDLGKNKRAAEGFELGMKEIEAGVLDPYLVYITLHSATDVGKPVRHRALALGERGTALYPNDILIQSQYRRIRYEAALDAQDVAAAFKEVDQLDLIEPDKAPHSWHRYGAYMVAYHQANDAGRTREAMQALVDSYPHAQNKDDQLMLANNIFSLACKVPDWQMALNSANMVLQLDPNMKNNESFMYWARHAYQQVNGNK